MTAIKLELLTQTKQSTAAAFIEKSAVSEYAPHLPGETADRNDFKCFVKLCMLMCSIGRGVLMLFLSFVCKRKQNKQKKKKRKIKSYYDIGK